MGWKLKKRIGEFFPRKGMITMATIGLLIMIVLILAGVAFIVAFRRGGLAEGGILDSIWKMIKFGR